MRQVRRILLDGLLVLIPPLLTLVAMVWIFRTIQSHVLTPSITVASELLLWSLADIRTEVAGQTLPSDETVVVQHGELLKRLSKGEFVPLDVYATAARAAGNGVNLRDGKSVYRQYIKATYLRPVVAIPLFLILFVLLMYLLGNAFRAGMGHAAGSLFERFVGRLPVVRTVYQWVRKITNFVLADNQLIIHRVVAVEYPCRGIWCVGFVTGNSLPGLAQATGEPMTSVLISTAPIPFKGVTINVPSRDLIELDFTIDEACRFFMSLGLMVPKRQQAIEARQEPIVQGNLPLSAVSSTAAHAQRAAESAGADAEGFQPAG